MTKKKETGKINLELTFSLMTASSNFSWKQFILLPGADLFQESVMKLSHILQLFSSTKTTGPKYIDVH